VSLLAAGALVGQQAETGGPLERVQEQVQKQVQVRVRPVPKVMLAEQLALVQEPQAIHQQRQGQVEEQVEAQAVGRAELER
jgi:hypothetical protein